MDSPLNDIPVQLSSSAIHHTPLLQDGPQLDFEGIIQDSKTKWIKVHVLTDTGASDAGFVSAKFVDYHHLSVVKLAQACSWNLQMINKYL